MANNAEYERGVIFRRKGEAMAGRQAAGKCASSKDQVEDLPERIVDAPSPIIMDALEKHGRARETQP